MAGTTARGLSFVLLLLGFRFLVPQAFGQDCSKPASEYRQSVVSLSVERTKKETGAVTTLGGTGFIVSPEGYVITAYHIVAVDADTDSVKISGSIGSLQGQKQELEMKAKDSSSDIALLRFRDTSHLYTPIPIGNPWKLPIGGELCSLSVSMALGADYQAITGTLSSRTGQDTEAGLTNLWTTQMPSNYGESGAPVLDLTRGGVVAIKYGGRNPANTQNVNYLTPINLADQLLRTYVGISVPLSDSPGVTTESSLQLVKSSGDQQVVPTGAWRNFAVKVLDAQGHPVSGARVAWETPVGGSLTYVGETNLEGVSAATNLYTFPNPGTYLQLAILVSKDTPLGFTQSDKIVSAGPAVAFTYQQK